MRILITGGCGFIGSNLVEKLHNETDDEIFIIDNLSTGKMENIQEYIDSSRVKFIKDDIRDSSIINKIRKQKFDVIYNFACPASPKYYLKNSIETWECSVLGVRNLLESIKGTKTKLFHSSTSEVYGDATIHPQSEDYWGNVNPYGVRACYDEGKRAAEALIFNYIDSYQLDVRIGRIFNTYGPKMNEQDGRIISNFVNQALNNNDITVYGTGEQRRSFCFITDTLDAILLMMNGKKITSPINVGTTYELSVLEVAEIVKRVLNSNSPIVFCESMQDDPQKRRPNIEKAEKILNWKPKVTFEEGLSKTIEYYKSRMM
ncbi:MAG: GDP-mannose 4,6-dehydratase [Bacilli bacterium]|nr:GDP-mannose 4,6-dehydratase [Bacilli bacterium]MDD4808844.1 GDP-mannose 4,6-dehydratase [Bacilli bacterium]